MNPLPSRKPLRLAGYDYAQNGAYFVTVCTQQKQYLFGHIDDGVMVLNDVGQIVKLAWMETRQLRKDIILGEFVIMPNHMHMIIFIVRIDCIDPHNQTLNNLDLGRRMQSAPTKVGYLIRGFKSATTS